MKENLRQRRTFSEALKRKAVKDIESGKNSLVSVCREYSISHTTIYRWLNDYSRYLQSSNTIVLQMDSEAYKTKELEKKVLELEAALGRKQLEVDFLNQMIEQGKKELGIDLKKKVLHSTLNWFRLNKRQHRYKIKDVYEVAGISKQAVHQHKIRQLQKATKGYEFFEQADKIRKEHPKARCRKMALDLSCCGWGRDKVEHLLLYNGYRIQYKRNYTRTTFAQHDIYHPNLIEGLELNDINQVVQTDITYYHIGDKAYYLVFLIDVYSRRIVGYAAHMRAEANIKALQMLLKTRKAHCLDKLIHHSDRGSQYIDSEYRKLLTDNGIRISMCKEAWENAYTERINRTIKEEYLNGWDIKDYQTLVKSVAKAIKHYNSKRRHQSLKMISPIQFEKQVENVVIECRPKEKIYKHL